MIFEKNPFTTAVSIPKSFHLTPPSPTLKNIDQPYCLILLCKRGPEESECLNSMGFMFTYYITILYCPAEYNLSAVPLSPITLAKLEIIENSYKENTVLNLSKDWLFSDL